MPSTSRLRRRTWCDAKFPKNNTLLERNSGSESALRASELKPAPEGPFPETHWTAKVASPRRLRTPILTVSLGRVQQRDEQRWYTSKQARPPHCGSAQESSLNSFGGYIILTFSPLSPRSQPLLGAFRRLLQ